MTSRGLAPPVLPFPSPCIGKRPLSRFTTTSPLYIYGHQATPLPLLSTTASHAKAGIRRPRGKREIAYLTNTHYTFRRRCLPVHTACGQGSICHTMAFGWPLSSRGTGYPTTWCRWDRCRSSERHSRLDNLGTDLYWVSHDRDVAEMIAPIAHPQSMSVAFATQGHQRATATTSSPGRRWRGLSRSCRPRTSNTRHTLPR